MNDYERIARVIRYLDEHQAEQPSLETLAAQLGLSPHHFHRLFSAWAGVTPKDFLQALTLAQVRERLKRGASVLDAALEAGFSGPGRLHDLCVTLEAASPGEIKSGGMGWHLQFGFAETPFGECLLAESPRGICHLAFVEPETREIGRDTMVQDWPAARWERNDALAKRQADLIFRNPAENESVPGLRAFVRGSAFQVQVWQALLRLNSGELVTYGRLAERVGHPSAARAVGTAVGQNHLAYLIPCHRVVRETGVIGQYRWGQIRKRAMIAWESSRAGELSATESL